MELLEDMRAFFAARVNGYDAHMLDEVEGCREGYRLLAQALPASVDTLLDLGCGTGLELEEVFRRFPAVQVTGIDLTPEMLDRLRDKYPDKALTLVQGDYTVCELGDAAFDAVISFQTMHHFAHEEKTALYRKIYRALKPGGVYVEGDYMVLEQAEEDACLAAYERLCREQKLDAEKRFHFDRPCTVDTQLRLLKSAGFQEAEKLWRQGNTTLIRAVRD